MYLLRCLITALSLVSLASSQSCYWPNGNVASALKACSVASGNEAAACCFADHYCMTNGLCLSPTEGTWYRGGCTDEQYEKTGCPKICDEASPGVHVGVSVCESKVFACYNIDNCATQNFTVGAYRAVMNAALSTDLFDSGATASTAAAAATATATATTSSTSLTTETATNPTCTSTQQDSSGISTGAAAGIGVAVGLPLAIAVAALSFMLMREKKKSRDAQAGYQQQHDRSQYTGYGQQPGYNQQPYTNTSSPWGKWESHQAPTAEIPGQTMPHELANVQDRHELHN